jgi:hypothetical protein
MPEALDDFHPNSPLRCLESASQHCGVLVYQRLMATPVLYDEHRGIVGGELVRGV